jgi:hypothetical protein
MQRRLVIGLSLLALIGAVAAFEVFGASTESRIGKRAPELPSD